MTVRTETNYQIVRLASQVDLIDQELSGAFVRTNIVADSLIDLLSYAVSNNGNGETNRLISCQSGVKFVNSPFPSDSGHNYATINKEVFILIYGIDIDGPSTRMVRLEWKDDTFQYIGNYNHGTNEISWSTSDKADKPATFIEDNIAKINVDGNYVDSGLGIDDVVSFLDSYIQIPAYQDFTNVTGTSLTITQNQNVDVAVNITDNNDIITNTAIAVLSSNNNFTKTGVLFTSQLTAQNTHQTVTLSAVPKTIDKDNIRIWYFLKIKKKDAPFGADFPNNVRVALQALDTFGLATDDEVATKITDKLYAKELNVDSVNGDDTNGTGSELRPYATLTKALSIADNSGYTIFLHGSITENITISRLNLTLVGVGVAKITGSITVSSSSSSNRINNIQCSNVIHTGAGGLYLQDKFQSSGFTKSGNGYLEATNCDLQGDLSGSGSITGSGNVNIFSSKLPVLVINNAAAIVNFSNNILGLPITITAGTLGINNTPIYSATGTSNAISSASGSMLVMTDVNLLTPTNQKARLNVASGSFYSFRGVIFDKASSTLGGINLGDISYFDALNAFNITLNDASTNTGLASLIFKNHNNTSQYGYIRGLQSGGMAFANAIREVASITQNGFEIHDTNYSHIFGGNYNNTDAVIRLGGLWGTRFSTYTPGGVNRHIAFETRGNLDPVTNSTVGATSLIIQGETGFIGVRTHDPKVPLHVASAPNDNQKSNGDTMYYTNNVGNQSIPSGTQSSRVGIYSESSILTSDFVGSRGSVSFSDRRIKDSISKTDNTENLNKLMKINVVNYQYKDKPRYGHLTHTKAIAQEIEEIFPEAIATTDNYVPNIYSKVSNIINIEINKDNIITSRLLFDKASVNFMSDIDMRIGANIKLYDAMNDIYYAQIKDIGRSYIDIQFDISLNKEKLDTIDIVLDSLNKKTIFVFGVEVNNFKSIDYNSIAMVNVSATQELMRQIEILKTQVGTLTKEMNILSSKTS